VLQVIWLLTGKVPTTCTARLQVAAQPVQLQLVLQLVLQFILQFSLSHDVLFCGTIAVACPGLAAAALTVPQQALALVNPAQESYGGLGRNTGKAGSSPKSPTRASMEGYTLEGTKKGGITPKRKAKLLAKARKVAEQEAK
jgi:hypothetical protein